MPGKHYGKKSKKLKLGGFMKKAAPMLGGAAGMLLGKMKKGGGLKSVPAGNKGLGKLPGNVRNKMGYKKKGGKMSYMKAGGPIEQFD